jgi:hypothetical protein
VIFCGILFIIPEALNKQQIFDGLALNGHNV